MLQVVEGRIMNSRDVGNAVAKLLLEGMPMDQIADIPGMPSAVQIAYLRKTDVAFADALHTAFEGAGIEAAFTLMKGARDGKIGKTQVESAQWVAERMAPDLFQERKTITNQEIKLTDEELAFQLQAAARSDERVMKLLRKSGVTMDGEMSPKEKARKSMKEIRRFVGRNKPTPRRKEPELKVINPEEDLDGPA